MENTDILNLWKTYDIQLERTISINQQMAKDINQIKVNKQLNSMKPYKIFAMVIGILWIFLLDSFIIKVFSEANTFFLISAILQSIITKIALGLYAYHLVLINEINISENIMEVQSRLSKLRASTLLVARILFLQLPLWTTFYLNQQMLQSGNFMLFILQGMVSISFTWLAIWLFFNIKYENKDKKWFKFIFQSQEWQPVLKAIELQKEIEELN